MFVGSSCSFGVDIRTVHAICGNLDFAAARHRKLAGLEQPQVAVPRTKVALPTVGLSTLDLDALNLDLVMCGSRIVALFHVSIRPPPASCSPSLTSPNPAQSDLYLPPVALGMLAGPQGGPWPREVLGWILSFRSLFERSCAVDPVQ